MRKAPDGGPEAHALHQAAHGQQQRAGRIAEAHCLAILKAEELLSQSEHLLVSVAEGWAAQTPEASELRDRCATIRSLQQQQRRARMSMGRKRSPEQD